MRKLLVSTALVTVALVALTACSNEDPATIDRPNAPKSSQSAKPTATPTADAEAAAKAEIVSTYTDFLTGVYQVNNDELEATLTNSVSGESSLTDEVKAKVVKALEDKYPFLKDLDMRGFDANTTGPIYGAYLKIGANENTPGAKLDVSIPKDAVTVTGDTATVDLTKSTVAYNRKPATASLSDQIKFNQVDGKWLIVPAAVAR